MYIQRYTSQNENFEYGYPNSNAFMQSRLKFERCNPQKAARPPTKCDVIDDAKLFPYTQDILSHFWRYPIRRRVTKASALDLIISAVPNLETIQKYNYSVDTKLSYRIIIHYIFYL